MALRVAARAALRVTARPAFVRAASDGPASAVSLTFTSPGKVRRRRVGVEGKERMVVCVLNVWEAEDVLRIPSLAAAEKKEEEKGREGKNSFSSDSCSLCTFFLLSLSFYPSLPLSTSFSSPPPSLSSYLLFEAMHLFSRSELLRQQKQRPLSSILLVASWLCSLSLPPSLSLIISHCYG